MKDIGRNPIVSGPQTCPMSPRRPWSGTQSSSLIYQSPQTLSESKFAKIQISHFGRGELVETNFQLLLLSPNLLKSKIPMYGVGGGGGETHGNQFPTFVAESKFARIQNSYVRWVGGGEDSWKPISNFCCRVQIC